VWGLRIESNNLGGNSLGVPFLVAPTGAGTMAASGLWLKVSYIDLLDGANAITTGALIDSTTILQNPGTITVPSGSIDASFKPNGLTQTVKGPVSLGGTSGTIDNATTSAIINASGTFALTLPPAASFPGRVVMLKQVGAQIINSASSNVVPVSSVTAGTAILGTTGKAALLQSDGTNWIVMIAN